MYVFRHSCPKTFIFAKGFMRRRMANVTSAAKTTSVCFAPCSIGSSSERIVVEVCGRLHRNQSQSLWRWVRHHDPLDMLARSAATRVDRPRQKQLWRLCNCHASRKTDSFGQVGLNQIQLRMSLILNVIFIQLGPQQANHPRQNYSDRGNRTTETCCHVPRQRWARTKGKWLLRAPPMLGR